MPVIWLIDAYRAGERGQVRSLVDVLGWPCEIKRLSYRSQVFLPHVLGQTTLRGLASGSAEQLKPPWPDLVISCGVRNEPVCRWIREQSGGRSRYVHVGRPWASLDSFDLVITTPQYRVPGRDNVLNNTLTLHGVTDARLAAASAEWTPKFSLLPRPHIAVIAGGDSGPFTFGPRAAARLAMEASALARENGGSLLVTTSSRTSAAAVQALRENIDVSNFFYAWKSGDSANPYFGILAQSDRLIVTADSIAMLSEACATGKPVEMFDIGGMREGHLVNKDFRIGGALYAILLRWFWQALSRDITLVHKQLQAAGRANWLGDDGTGTAQDSTDMRQAVAAVRALLGDNGIEAGIHEPGAPVD